MKPHSHRILAESLVKKTRKLTSDVSGFRRALLVKGGHGPRAAAAGVVRRFRKQHPGAKINTLDKIQRRQYGR